MKDRKRREKKRLRLAPNPEHSTAIPIRAVRRQQDRLQKGGEGKKPAQDVSV